MAKKKTSNPGPYIPDVIFEDDMECQRCGALGAADFIGDILCPKCVADEVFKDYDPKNN